ncbi:MAG: Zn-ribbon domain-containing OB-fold protein [Mycobacteriales bacterium]
MSAGKLVGSPDDLNLEFFQIVVATGQLHLQQCLECSSYSHPPRYYCRCCFSPNWRFVPVAGSGQVYSYTVSHYTAEAAWRDELPFATVVVELEEGPRLVASAVVADPAELRLGQRVHVAVQARSEEFAVFTATPMGDPRPEGGADVE